MTVLDYLFNSVLGFALGYKVPYAIVTAMTTGQEVVVGLLEPGGWWWSGGLGALALGGYYGYLGWQQRDVAPVVTPRFPSDRLGSLVFWAGVGGLLGAKLLAALEDFTRLVTDPLAVLLGGGGLAIYGGLLGGAMTVYAYLRRHRIAVRPFMDAIAPALIVGYGIGRMGCQLSGDGDWGIVAGPPPAWWCLPEWGWRFRFPHNVLKSGLPIPGCTADYCHQLAEGVFPTSMYETVLALGIGGLLWGLRGRLAPWPGLLFCGYLILNGVERFLIEGIRVNERYEWLGGALSQAQWIALGFILAGVLGGYGSYRRGKYPRPKDLSSHH